MTLHGAPAVWRTAIGVDAQGDLIYAAARGPDVGGARRGHGPAALRARDGARHQPRVADLRHLRARAGARGPSLYVPNPNQIPGRFLYPSTKDFFAVFASRRAGRAPAVVARHARGPCGPPRPGATPCGRGAGLIAVSAAVVGSVDVLGDDTDDHDHDVDRRPRRPGDDHDGAGDASRCRAVGDTELGNTPQLPPNPATYLAAGRAALAAPIVFGNLEGTMTNADDLQVRARVHRVLRLPGPHVVRARSTARRASRSSTAPTTTPTTSAPRAWSRHLGRPAAAGHRPGRPARTDRRRSRRFDRGSPSSTSRRTANTNNLLNSPAAAQLIARARQIADVVVVYMHAGAEGSSADHVTRATETYVGENRGNPYAFAHAAIDDGADLVVASGPHVLRGMEWYRGHLIDYSLGDFANYYDFATAGAMRLSAILHVTLSATGSLRLGTLHLGGAERVRSAVRRPDPSSRLVREPAVEPGLRSRRGDDRAGWRDRAAARRLASSRRVDLGCPDQLRSRRRSRR